MRGEKPGRPRQHWAFCIYIADDTPRSRVALQNLTELCDAHVPGRYTIEVVDVLRAPERVRSQEVLAIPTIVRTAPAPIRTVIGDLSDSPRAVAGLQLPS